MYFYFVQCNGSNILWKHIVDLYYHNSGAHTNAPGVPCLVPKLRYEHIRLTSFSKMRVDLAAQVIKALIMCICMVRVQVQVYLCTCMY